MENPCKDIEFYRFTLDPSRVEGAEFFECFGCETFQILYQRYSREICINTKCAEVDIDGIVKYIIKQFAVVRQNNKDAEFKEYTVRKTYDDGTQSRHIINLTIERNETLPLLKAVWRLVGAKFETEDITFNDCTAQPYISREPDVGLQIKSHSLEFDFYIYPEHDYFKIEYSMEALTKDIASRLDQQVMAHLDERFGKDKHVVEKVRDDDDALCFKHTIPSIGSSLKKKINNANDLLLFLDIESIKVMKHKGKACMRAIMSLNI